jgi:hypothetical protein
LTGGLVLPRRSDTRLDDLTVSERGETMTATVRWFKNEKGFGRIEYASVVRAAGARVVVHTSFCPTTISAPRTSNRRTTSWRR